MWADAQCDGRPAKYRWRPLLNATVWLMPSARVPCSSAANIGERKIWTQSEFCIRQNSVRGGKSHRKCICSIPAQEMPKHRARFGWPPVSDVAAVTKQRRETRWNFLGCPKLANRSQQLISRSSAYCENIWMRYCRLTFFSDCGYIP